MTESGLTSSFSSFLRTCRCILSTHMGLCTLRHVRWSWIWSPPTAVSSSFSQSLPFPSCDLCGWLEHLPVETEIKNFENFSFFHVQVPMSPFSFWRRPIFSRLPFTTNILLELLFFPLTSLARFNSIRVLASLSWSKSFYWRTLFLFYYCENRFLRRGEKKKKLLTHNMQTKKKNLTNFFSPVLLNKWDCMILCSITFCFGMVRKFWTLLVDHCLISAQLMAEKLSIYWFIILYLLF